MESAWRRLMLALVAIGASATLLRGQLSAALVVRGDELMTRNAYAEAGIQYRRALWLDQHSETAVDRLAFLAIQRRTKRSLTDSISVTSEYLRTHADSAVVLFDRGLCFLLLRRYVRAFPDFRSAALLTKDPQQFVFAGWMAKRSGNLPEAIRLWNRALEYRHDYRPASLALKEAGK